MPRAPKGGLNLCHTGVGQEVSVREARRALSVLSRTLLASLGALGVGAAPSSLTSWSCGGCVALWPAPGFCGGMGVARKVS